LNTDNTNYEVLWLSVISGFRRDVDEIRALLEYYTASCGNCLPTFRANVSVPSSRFKKSNNKSYVRVIRCILTLIDFLKVEHHWRTLCEYSGRVSYVTGQ
jgi:hypothetical protein